jgi:hypothetical protein
MSDEGLLKMDLLCPRGHVAARLIRQVAHDPIRIDLPGRARAEWPREDDETYTRLDCQGCNPPLQIYGPTPAIQQKATELSEDEFDWQGSYRLGEASERAWDGDGES